MTPPSFSIVTPSFQQGRFIRATIDSVLSQASAIDLEYFVADGGSTDDTVAVLRSYGSALTWVSERDGGQADAVNKGLRRATGRIIGWLNSDDVYEPGALASALRIFEAHSDVDVVYGCADYIDESGRRRGEYRVQPFDHELLKRECFIAQPALFFRREVVERFGEIDPGLHYALDYEYWLRLAAGGARFHFLQQRLASCRVHPAAKTESGKMTHSRECIAVTQRHAGTSPPWLFQNIGKEGAARVGLDIERHPFLYRAVASIGMYGAVLAYAPRELPQVLRWQWGRHWGANRG